jgi:hypothetical protein
VYQQRFYVQVARLVTATHTKRSGQIFIWLWTISIPKYSISSFSAPLFIAMKLTAKYRFRVGDLYTFKNSFQKSKLSTTMKAAEHKENLSNVRCHLCDFNMSSTGDSTHVRMIMKSPNTGQHLHVNLFTSIWNANLEFTEILSLWEGIDTPLYVSLKK